MGMTDNEPWYHAGLAFSCTRCGSCCTGEPGYVWVDTDRIEKLAAFRDESAEDFMRQFVRRVGTRSSLIERPNGDCIFWDRDQGCTVYEARPVQCRTWPFWRRNVARRADWERTCRVCPGAGQGAWHDVEEIEESVVRTERSRS